MKIDLDIPPKFEIALREEWGDLAQALKEAIAIESYRSGKISVGFLAEMLGMGVIEAQGWLANRNVPMNCGPEDLDADLRDLAELFPELRQ